MSAKEKEVAPSASAWPTDAELDFVFEAYERGMSLEALTRAQAVAPLARWRGTRACILGSRIAANTGSGSLALRLAARAWKNDRRSVAALVQYGYDLLGYRGPLAVWRWLRDQDSGETSSTEDVAELFALRSRAAASLRDFSIAEHWLERAEQLDANRPWIRLQRAYLLECQDRIEDALETAEAACGLHRHSRYRPGIQTRAHLLQLLDRDDDAIALLSDTSTHLQSAPIVAQLYGLLTENDRWQDAANTLETYPTFAPLLEPRGERWLTSQRALVAYRLGRRAGAAQAVSTLEDDFHKEFAERLSAEPPTSERVQLDVTFVRQHFKTCAPATLAAIGRYWQMPSEHLQLAEAVCYDGTPHWQQRDWAERNGWHVREFRVTHESAIELLKRGVPFAISTVDTTSAHMMAVIGFDLARGTLLLRDPSQPYVVEMIAKEFLERQRPFGPRGTIFIPQPHRDRVADVSLPDEPLYDAYYRLGLALSQHDRTAAAAALATLERNDAESIVTWDARYELACYDANPIEQLRCATKALELFPDSAARILRRSHCLGDGGRQERIDFLSNACANKHADAALFIALARALQGDARRAGDAQRCVKRALRQRSMESSAIATLADLRWDDGRLDEATELYQFAATIEGFREHLYQSWFIACRRTRRTETALAHLEDRFARFGARSDQPALTLAWAWHQMEQPARAWEVLEKAISLRAENGALQLRAATLRAECGDAAAANQLLSAAQAKVRENDWLRAKLSVAENNLDFAAALDTAREILQREPLALDAHLSVARALWRREGAAAALEHLKSAGEQYPHHVGLKRMHAEWSRDAGPVAVEASVRELLRLESADGWAYRELALSLCRQGKFAEAIAAAQEGARIEPTSTYSASILGLVLLRSGDIAAARTELRRAIELSVDNEDAITHLLDLSRTDAERKEVLAFVEQELKRQVVSGNGLLTFVDVARPILDGESLLGLLRLAQSTRPDLWHAWSALVAQLGHMQRLDDALAVAREASERFPYLPRTWLDLANVHRWRDEIDAEIAAARRAIEINAGWTDAVLALTNALMRAGKLDEAQQAFESALQLAPRDAQLNAVYGHLLWRQQKIDAAFAAVERAVRISPNYSWPWDLLIEWSEQLQQRQRPLDFARSLIAERPGEARGWLMLANVLSAPESSDERFAAVDRALELEPRLAESWDLKAELLALAERFDEAIATCNEGLARIEADTHILRGRIAWIEARRRRFDQAIALMRAVLADNAGYVWGWLQLSLWLQEQEDFAGAAAALETMQQLRPHDAWVGRQLGLCRLKQGDKEGAEKALLEAFETAPTDLVAAHNLFDLQLERGDIAAAANTVRVMQMHQPGAATLSASINIQLREGKLDDALDSLRALGMSPDPEAWPHGAAADAFIRAGASRKAAKILKRCARDGGNPECAVSVVRILCAHESFTSAVYFFRSLPSGEAQRRAAAPLIQVLAEKGKKVLFAWLLKTRREVLHGDDAAWGIVGYALTVQGNMKAVAGWLADWQQRPNVQPWMLFNYCLALRCTGRQEEATIIAERVVEHWSHRDGADDVRLFLAIENALERNVEAAQEHLRRASKGKSTQYDAQMIALTQAMIDLQNTSREARPQRWRELETQLDATFTPLLTWRTMADVRASLRRAARLAAEEGAGARASLWFKWKLHWQWSLLLLIPLLPYILANLSVASTPLLAFGAIWAMLRSLARSR